MLAAPGPERISMFGLCGYTRTEETTILVFDFFQHPVPFPDNRKDESAAEFENERGGN